MTKPEDIRGSLEAAFNSTDDDAPEQPIEAGEPAEDAAGEAEAPEAEPGEPEADAEPDESAEAKAQRARDEAGRFTKAQKAKADAAAKAAVVPTDPKATTTPSPQDRAPQSWSPAAREEWAKTPPNARAQILKREREIATTLQETASDRRTAQGLRETVAPYQHLLGGADPIPVVKSFFHTAHQLASPNAQTKAQAAAHLIKAYGVDVEHLAHALDGTTPAARPGQPQQPAEFRDPRVDQMLSQQAAEKQRRDQAMIAEAQKKLDTFEASHEFFPNVRKKMAHLHAAMMADGLKPTPEELYTLACQADPEVAGILKQRGSAPQANAKASTQRARAAASSIRGQPAPVAKKGQPDDARSVIEAAMNGEL